MGDFPKPSGGGGLQVEGARGPVVWERRRKAAMGQAPERTSDGLGTFHAFKGRDTGVALNSPHHLRSPTGQRPS